MDTKSPSACPRCGLANSAGREHTFAGLQGEICNQQSWVRAERPDIGDIITEGFGLYEVLYWSHGTHYRVRSVISGVEITIDWIYSGYRDPAHRWHVVERRAA